METSKQPEALRLAEILFGMTAAFPTPSHERGVLNGSASELRRQHAEIERLQAERDELVEAVKHIALPSNSHFMDARSCADWCRSRAKAALISTATGAAA